MKMDNVSRKRFNSRSFTALGMLFSGLGLPLTGFANHVYGFDPLTLERHAWMSTHNSMGILFLVFAVWHAVLNRRALLHHLRNGAAAIPALSREALLAAALVGFALLFFTGHAFIVSGH